MDRKDIIALLVNKGIEVKADISDADLTAALNKALGGKADEPQNNGLTIEDVTKAVANAVKPLQDQLNANSDKELDGVVAQVVAMNKGIDEATAKTMGLAACNSFLAANGHVAVNAHGKQTQVNASDSCSSLKLEA